MVEVLTILAIATKEVKCGRFSELISCIFSLPELTSCSEKYFKKLMGNREIEDSLESLDRLTQEEARMASVEQLKMTHNVDRKVTGVERHVQDVRSGVQDVGDKVQTVEGRVQDVGIKVQGVDDKLDQVNSSLSLQTLTVIPPLRHFHREPTQR
jgi:hypothetical protein